MSSEKESGLSQRVFGALAKESYNYERRLDRRQKILDGFIAGASGVPESVINGVPRDIASRIAATVPPAHDKYADLVGTGASWLLEEPLSVTLGRQGTQAALAAVHELPVDMGYDNPEDRYRQAG